MKTRLLNFINALRAGGLGVTVSETLDAMRAVSAVGVERTALREGLATALLKDEADRPVFVKIFDQYFAVPKRQRGKGEASQDGSEGSRARAGSRSALPHPSEQPERSNRPKEHPPPPEKPRPSAARETPARLSAQRLAAAKTLRLKPFAEMSADEVEACALLMADLSRRFLAYARRRRRAARRGRLDIRRTLRHSMGYGGVPLDPAFREPRPARTDLVALCDCSHSVATASRFLLTLLMPAQRFFRRTRLFAFVDRPVEVSVEDGNIIPHDRLDLYARSDFGRVLESFWTDYEPLLTRDTVVLILGDARNNRRPPRADVLARISRRARRILWLNPESPQRWNTGDSVMETYRRHGAAVLAAANVKELESALKHLYRSVVL